MKKKLCLLLATSMLLAAGCSSQPEKSEAELREEIKAELEAEMAAESNEAENQDGSDETATSEESESSTEDTTDKVAPELKDYIAIKEYMLNDPIFVGLYQEANYGDPYDDSRYLLKHVDFNGDGMLDTIITTTNFANNPHVSVFVTYEDDAYHIYATDLRISEDEELYLEDDFLVISSGYGYHRLAKVVSMDDMNIIFDLQTSYVVSEEKNPYKLSSEMAEKTLQSIEKIDGLKSFKNHSKTFYYDENKKEHLVSHSYEAYTYNEDDMMFTSEFQQVVDNNLLTLVKDNLITGDSTSLSTFNEIIDQSNSIKKAIDYYLDHKKEFTLADRMAYLDAYNEFTSIFNYSDIYPIEESINNNQLTVTVYDFGMNEALNEIFSLVKSYYIEDGAASRSIARDNEMGFYTVTCISPEYSAKIRQLQFDSAILNDVEVVTRDFDDLVDIAFTNKEETIKELDKIGYPVLLLNDLSEYDQLEDESIWKITAVIVPEKIIIQEETFGEESNFDEGAETENYGFGVTVGDTLGEMTISKLDFGDSGHELIMTGHIERQGTLSFSGEGGGAGFYFTPDQPINPVEVPCYSTYYSPSEGRNVKHHVHTETEQIVVDQVLTEEQKTQLMGGGSLKMNLVITEFFDDFQPDSVQHSYYTATSGSVIE